MVLSQAFYLLIPGLEQQQFLMLLFPMGLDSKSIDFSPVKLI